MKKIPESVWQVARQALQFRAAALKRNIDVDFAKSPDRWHFERALVEVEKALAVLEAA